MKRKANKRANGKGERLLCLTFPPDLIQFLDGLAWEILRKSGSQRKLDRMDLLRALVRVFKAGSFDVNGIRTEDEFVKALLAQIKDRRCPRSRRKRK